MPLPPHSGHMFSSADRMADRMNSERFRTPPSALSSELSALNVTISDLAFLALMESPIASALSDVALPPYYYKVLSDSQAGERPRLAVNWFRTVLQTAPIAGPRAKKKFCRNRKTA